MEKILMYCYKGESWEDTPIRDRGIYDVSQKTANQVAELAELQWDFQGRNVRIKRIQE